MIEITLDNKAGTLRLPELLIGGFRRHEPKTWLEGFERAVVEEVHEGAKGWAVEGGLAESRPCRRGPGDCRAIEYSLEGFEGIGTWLGLTRPRSASRERCVGGVDGWLRRRRFGGG
jgi:hypothetical protein